MSKAMGYPAFVRFDYEKITHDEEESQSDDESCYEAGRRPGRCL